MNSSSVREFTMSSIFVSWFDYKFVFFSQTHSQFPFSPEFTIFLANSQWIHYFFAISLWSSIYFAFCVRIHYQFLDLTINALFVRFITMESLAITLYDYELTKVPPNIRWIRYLFANSLWTQYLFREFTIKILSFSWFDFDFSIFFVDLQCISNFSR